MYPATLRFGDLEPHQRRGLLDTADVLRLTVTHHANGSFSVTVPDPKAAFCFGSLSMAAMVRPQSLVEFSEAMSAAAEPAHRRIQ